VNNIFLNPGQNSDLGAVFTVSDEAYFVTIDANRVAFLKLVPLMKAGRKVTVKFHHEKKGCEGINRVFLIVKIS